MTNVWTTTSANTQFLRNEGVMSALELNFLFFFLIVMETWMTKLEAIAKTSEFLNSVG